MADKKGNNSKRKHYSGTSNVPSNRAVRETPYQDIYRIRRNILAIRETKGSLSPEDLFMDPSFTSDMTSLAYVYSGDDKYEKAVFKRPHEVTSDPVLVGVGGVCDEPFPWRHWKQRYWLQAALVTVSLSVRHLEKIIPGYKNFEQGFVNDYTGAFHFNIWRFGEWVDIVVDDRLPLLDDRHLFCGPMGSAQELWGPLVEKAYAKCKKTYQSIEYGNTLDALTDLTGAVCEHFTPDVRPPRNLFRILVKSHLARSQMVCWRNEKRLTPTGFYVDIEQQEDHNQRYLHVITAVTKFPTTDGRLLEMVRLKCPFAAEPKWQGRFSDRDYGSWESVNRDFMHRFQPVTKKDEDEYWMSTEDFRCNFGGLFIISSPEPFRVDGLSLARSYHLQDGWDYHSSFLTGDFVQAPSSSTNNRYFRRSSTPKPEHTEEGLLDSDSLKLARRRTSHASLLTSGHSSHFHPPRHPHNHHYQRAMKKEQKQMVPNEEEITTDTQSLFTKRNSVEKGKMLDMDSRAQDVAERRDSGGKKGFFFRSSNQYQQAPKPHDRDDIQALAMVQNEYKRSGRCLKNVLQTGFESVKLTLDDRTEQDPSAYETSTDPCTEEESKSRPAGAFAPPAKRPETKVLEQAKTVPYLHGSVKTGPCRRTASSGDMSSRVPETFKPIPSPKPVVKFQTPPPKPDSLIPPQKSPKPLPKSPKPLPKSPKPLRSPKPPVKAPKPPVKPPSKDRGASTPSPTLVKKMTPPTNVATVIGNVSPTLATKEGPAKSPKPAPRTRGSLNPNMTNTELKSSLTPPVFKPPKSPTPHGKRYFRAVSPTPQRATSPLPSPDSLKSPEIFSITITRDKSSENLSVPYANPEPQYSDRSELTIYPAGTPVTTSATETVSEKSDNEKTTRGNTLSLSLSSLQPQQPVATGSPDTDTSTNKTHQDKIPLSIYRTSPPKSPRPQISSISAGTDPKPSSAFQLPDGQISTLPDSFFQPVLHQSSPKSSPNTPTDSEAVVRPVPQTEESSNVQTNSSYTGRGALRSVSSSSDTGSTHSSSDIFLHFKPSSAPAILEGSEKFSNAAGLGTDSSIAEEMGDEGDMEGKDKGFLLPASGADGRRPHSAPQSNIARHFSSSSLSSLTQGNFRATKADYFRSDGRWRPLLEVFDKWTSTKLSACRSNMDLHSRSQRHHFHISRQEYVDEISPPTFHGKRHVLVSLLQDYRHGAVTANSLLVPIGFCIYKCKSVERDDKRHISRFQLIEQMHGEPEMREVTARLDLEPGYYFTVPFYRTEGHTGEYLLRVLTEDCPQAKAGCRVS